MSTAPDIIIEAAWQYDAQAALHRIRLTGDWSELRDLSDYQLAWSLRLAAPESPLRQRIIAEQESRRAQEVP